MLIRGNKRMEISYTAVCIRNLGSMSFRDDLIHFLLPTANCLLKHNSDLPLHLLSDACRRVVSGQRITVLHPCFDAVSGFP